MTLYAKLALVLALFAAGFASGWKVDNWRHDANEVERMEQQSKEAVRRADKVDTAAAGHEADKQRIRTVVKTVVQEVEHVVEKPFYLPSEQCFDDDGLRELRTAIGVAPSASEPARALPRPEPAK